MFVKYPHLERLGTSEVEGIENGVCHVFPKLDGTNASLWFDVEANQLQAGSRNRQLSLESDNAGFYSWALKQENHLLFASSYPDFILYGEWLVPHSLTTYHEDAWRKFYIFDVFDRKAQKVIAYEEYKPFLEAHKLEYLTPIAIVRNGVTDHFLGCLERNNHLIKDGQGIGEGVVVKNYNWTNKFGRVIWAKLITNAFKVEHHKAMSASIVGGVVLEETIVTDFVTQHLVDKTVAKITLENDGWSGKLIPKLLGLVWYDLINEEIWEILKKHKNPKIDFATLNRFVVMRVKELRKDIF